MGGDQLGIRAEVLPRMPNYANIHLTDLPSGPDADRARIRRVRAAIESS
jgi:hypothetical protein